MKVVGLKSLPDEDKRKLYLELSAKYEKLEDEKYEAASLIRIERERTSEEKFWVPFREKLKAHTKPYDDKIEAIEKEYEDRQKAIELEIEALNLGDRQYDSGYEYAYICDLTGLPIFDTDEFIKDEDSGVTILRAVLPWPEKAT